MGEEPGEALGMDKASNTLWFFDGCGSFRKLITFKRLPKTQRCLGFMPLRVIINFIRETYLSKLMRLCTFKTL